MSAYVEIIFDNSDDRFPTGNKEVVLRRTIGLKKDEYSVDRKVVTKSDVMNLLEAAGFSRSNPYYIVPQGRVTALTNMKESDRLNLLKEVAGTQVYEARRAESLKIMNETNNKREKIDELLEYIKERLSELEEEKEELRGFQDKDRQRRCLEYAYHHREQVTIHSALEDIDNARQDGLDNTDSSRSDLVKGEKAISKIDAEIHKLEREAELLKIDRRQFEEDRRDYAKALAKVELRAKSMKDGQSARDQARAQQNAELKTVRAEMSEKQKELSQIMPNFEAKRQEEAAIKKQLDAADSARARLFAKQNRGSRFRNKADRDTWLQQEINDLESTISTQKANMIEANEEVSRVQNTISIYETEIADMRSRLTNWSSSRGQLVEQATKARDTLDKLNDERKTIRREDDKLNSIISNAQHEKERAERDLSHAMDGQTARGLATIRRLKQEQDIPGAYGTLADLIEVNEAYRLPVEQIAGASLFHYVVDDAETATFLADTLHRQRGGRVTFMPLEQLRPRAVKMPRSDEAIPLLSKITYDEGFEKAMQQVFGKAVVCPNLALAGKYAKSHGVDAITVDGDTTNKRGAMTGGYIDPRKSRLEAVQAANKWREEYERLVGQGRTIRKQIELKDQEITGAMSDVQKTEQKMRQADDGFEPLRHELRNKSAHIESERNHLDSALKRRETVEKNMSGFMEEAEAHKAEIGTEFKKSLSTAEEKQLEELSRSSQQLHKQWNESSSIRRDLERRKQVLEVDLRQNLQMRLDQLSSLAAEDSAGGDISGGQKAMQKELKKAQSTLHSVEESLREVESKLEDLSIHIEQAVQNKSTREQNLQELSARIEKQQKRMEKTLQRKALLTTQAAECAKNIRELGVLPEEAFEKYENMESKTVSGPWFLIGSSPAY